MRLKATAWCSAAVVVVLLAAGCASLSSSMGGAGLSTAHETGMPASAAATASPAPTGTPGGQRIPIRLKSLQMTSATTGWALYNGRNGTLPNPLVLLARTSDGGRAWRNVTPAAALALLATPYSQEVLDPVDGERAYLAVTGAAEESNGPVNTTMVFATADGGRTWTGSAPLRAHSTVSMVSFADAVHGWVLLGGDGGAMGQDPVWLYRTSDGGKHWSQAASTPPLTGATLPPQSGPGRIPIECDKYGLDFPAPAAGWLASTCNAGLGGTLLVTADGGTSWARQPLPLRAAAYAGNACFATGLQFTGGAGFVTIESAAASPALLVTGDLGRTWQRVALPAGAGQYPQIRFFSPAQGVLVAAGTQGSFGSTFFTTADGGRTWTPVPQGRHFSPGNFSIGFAGPRAGFAWNTGMETTTTPPTTIYATANAGRTWRSYAATLAMP